MSGTTYGSQLVFFTTPKLSQQVCIVIFHKLSVHYESRIVLYVKERCLVTSRKLSGECSVYDT